MKINKFIVASMVVGLLTVSCNNAESTTDEENTDNTAKTEQEADIETDEVDETANEESSEATLELEDRTYTVEEFAKIFEESKDAIAGQTVSIEGYYMNYNKQKDANSDEDFQFNVNIYQDESFDRDGAQAFFIMKDGNADQFKGIKQKDKIVISGKITDKDFFGAPRLEEGVIVK